MSPESETKKWDQAADQIASSADFDAIEAIWIDIHDRFQTAKNGRNAALAAARKKLDAAQRAYDKAVRAAPEALLYEDARAEITRFRRWAFARGLQFTDPRNT